MKTVSATDAKNNFGVVLDAVGTEPVQVVKNGKVAAYVVSPTDFDAMQLEFSFTRAKTAVIAKNRNVMAILQQYSMGNIRKEDAVKTLGIKYYGRLLDLLGIANLPLPSVSSKELSSMQAALAQVSSRG